MQHRLAEHILGGGLGRGLAHGRGRAEGRAGEFETVEPRRDRRERECPHHALAIKLRARQRDQRLEFFAVLARQHPADRNAVRAATLAAERDRPRGERLGKFVLDPRRAAVRRRRQGQLGGEIVVQQRLSLHRALAARDDRAGCGGILLPGGSAIRHDRAVSIVRRLGGIAGVVTRTGVANLPDVRRRCGQLTGKFSRPCHGGFAPHQFLHRFRRLDPGPACFAPAGRTENRHLQSQPVGLRCRVAHGLVPLRGAVRGLRVHVLAAPGVDVCEHESADAHPFHPFEILGNAVLRDIAHRPVPPRPGQRRFRRLAEPGFQRVTRGLASRHTGDQQSESRQCRARTRSTEGNHDTRRG